MASLIPMYVQTTIGDTLSGTMAKDILYGNDGSDLLFGNDSADTLYGGGGNDTLDGGKGADVIYGNDGNDWIIYDGTDAAAKIFGGEGIDVLDASASSKAVNVDLMKYGDIEIFVGSAGNDTIAYNSNFHKIDGGDSSNDLLTAAKAKEGISLVAGGEIVRNVEKIIGSNYNDVIMVGQGQEGANFYFNGGGGADSLAGGFGVDSLLGGAGNDTILYDAQDWLFGGAGIDILDVSGETGNVTIDLSDITAKYREFEAVIGGSGRDTLRGDGKANLISAGNGGNLLDGGAGKDTIIGGSGDDTIVYDGADVSSNISGGTGSDWLDAGNAIRKVVIKLDQYQGIENVNGSDFSDLIIGGAETRKILSGAGDDTIGYDFSTMQNTVVDGGNDSDVLIAMNATSGVELRMASTITNVESFIGSQYDDTLYASGSDRIWDGGAGNDSLMSGAGNDILRGGAGNDTYIFRTGFGHDIITADKTNSGDVLVLDGINGNSLDISRSGSDLVFSIIPVTDGGVVDTLTQKNWYSSGTNKISRFVVDGALSVFSDFVIGNDNNNTLTTSAVNAYMDGHAGNDIMRGGKGNDLMKGGEGDDSLYGNAGNDELEGGLGNDFLDGGAGDDLLSAQGNDTLLGGLGNDTYVFSFGSGKVVIDNSHKDKGNDVVAFEGQMLSTNVMFSNDSNDVVMRGLEGGELLRFKDWKLGNDHHISEIAFADKHLTDSQIEAMLTDSAPGGQAGNDTLSGGVLLIRGNDGDNALYGTPNDDILDGGLGNDILTGGDGNDTYRFTGTVFGNDTITASPANRYDVIAVDNIDGCAFSGNDLTIDVWDNASGKDQSIVVQNWSAEEKNNRINTFLVNDGSRYYGTQGITDEYKLYVGLGNDFSSSTENILYFGLGMNEQITGGAGKDMLAGGWDNDTIHGGQNDDELYGYGGNDVLIGGTGNDYLDGSSGDDTLTGGTGADVYRYGRGSTYNAPQGNDVITASADNSEDLLYLRSWDNPDYMAKSGNDLQIHYRGNDNKDYSITVQGWYNGDGYQINQYKSKIGNNQSVLYNLSAGNDLDDVADFTSSTGNVMYSGLGGNDRMLSGKGDDWLYGGDGSDTISGGLGADTLYGGGGNDSLTGGAGNDLLNGGGGNDTLLGGEGNDHLKGKAGNDILTGGLGNDTYSFELGYGNDVITADNANGTDVIRLGTSSFITSKNSSNDLVFSFYGNDPAVITDSLTVQQWFNNSDANRITRFVDYNGVALTLDLPQEPTKINGSDASQSLSGTANSEQIFGLGGDDRLNGMGGTDTLIGGTGADTYVFDLGLSKEHLTIASDKTNSADTLQLVLSTKDLPNWVNNSTINPHAEQQGNDLLLALDTNHSLVLQGWYQSDPGYKVGHLTISAAGANLDLSYNLLLGNDSGIADNLVGSAAGELIFGLGGNDSLFGNGGNDILSGDSGNDVLNGGEGNDILMVTDGSDTLSGGAGNDMYVVELGGGYNFGYGSSAARSVITSNSTNGNDSVYISIDRIGPSYGGYYDGINHWTDPVAQHDRIAMQVTDNHELVLSVKDAYAPNDSSRYTSFMTIQDWDLDGGHKLNNFIFSGDGNYTIDSVDGKLVWRKSAGTVAASSNDTFISNSSNHYLAGNGGNDTLIGGAGNDTYAFTAGQGSIYIQKDEANNQDTLRLIVDTNAVQFTQNWTPVVNKVGNDLVLSLDDADKITMQDWYADPKYQIHNLMLSVPGTGALAGTSLDLSYSLLMGGEGADNLTGSAGAELMFGGGGNDSILGSGGGDVLIGDEGNDTLSGGAGDDIMMGGAGNDKLYGGDGFDMLQGGEGVDTLDGGGGNDVYFVSSHGTPWNNSTHSYDQSANVDVLTGGASNHNDAVYLDQELTISNLLLSTTNGNDLLITKHTQEGSYSWNEDLLRIQNFGLSADYRPTFHFLKDNTDHTIQWNAGSSPSWK